MEERIEWNSISDREGLYVQGHNFRFNCKEIATSGLNMINSSSCLYSQWIILKRDVWQINFTFIYLYIWLNEGISNNKVAIENFSMYRKDRSEVKGGHAGGEIVYVRD